MDRVVSMDLTDKQKEAWDKLGQRYEDIGFGELLEEEQHFVALEALAGDTLNGALDQYFLNSSGDLALVAIEALEKLGEKEASSTLQTVISELWPNGYPADRIARFDKIAEAEDTSFLESESEVIVATHERFLTRCLDVLAELYASTHP